MAATLHIEHRVIDYPTWKAVFDSDPAGRVANGVRAYTIRRAGDDLNHVVIDLDFDDATRADAFLQIMQGIWPNVQGKLIESVTARVLQDEESARL